jgi:hypothetical protein
MFFCTSSFLFKKMESLLLNSAWMSICIRLAVRFSAWTLSWRVDVRVFCTRAADANGYHPHRVAEDFVFFCQKKAKDKVQAFDYVKADQS